MYTYSLIVSRRADLIAKEGVDMEFSEQQQQQEQHLSDADALSSSGRSVALRPSVRCQWGMRVNSRHILSNRGRGGFNSI